MSEKLEKASFKEIIKNKSKLEKTIIIIGCAIFILGMILFSISFSRVDYVRYGDSYYYYNLWNGYYGFILIPLLLLSIISLFITFLLIKYNKFKVAYISSAIFYFLVFVFSLGANVVVWGDSSKIAYIVMRIVMGFIFLFSFINFILLLIKNLEGPSKKSRQEKAKRNAVEKLQELKMLYDKDILTEEEYNERRMKYIYYI